MGFFNSSHAVIQSGLYVTERLPVRLTEADLLQRQQPKQRSIQGHSCRAGLLHRDKS
jgi:hypothetical protein